MAKNVPITKKDKNIFEGDRGYSHGAPKIPYKPVRAPSSPKMFPGDITENKPARFFRDPGIGNFSDGAAERDWATLAGLQANRTPASFGNPVGGSPSSVAGLGSGVGNGRGSGSGGNGGAAAPAPDPGLPFDSIYDKLVTDVRGIGQQNLSDLDAIRATIAKNYANASSQIYQQYQGSREGLDSQAQALGVNGADIYKDYDANLRQVQENSDQSQAMDESWFDKMKALRGSELDDLYINLTNEKAMQQANWLIQQAQMQAALSGGGGGGGGGRGGGGSSSGRPKITETATETETLDTIWNQDYYNQLLASGDTEGASLYALSEASTSPNRIIKDLATRYKSGTPAITGLNQTPRPVSSQSGGVFNWVFGNKNLTDKKSKAAIAAKKQQDKNNSTIMRLILGAASTGGYGTPTAKQTVVTKGTQKVQ